MYVRDQPRQGPTVNMEGNTRSINIFSLIFTEELTDSLVEWTNSSYAQKKRLQPDKHRMKWTDTYPDEIRAFPAVLMIMNDIIDMITVLRSERHFRSEDSKWYLQISGITTTFTGQAQTVEKVFTFL